MTYLRYKHEEFNQDNYYLAQIAAEIRRGNATPGSQILLSDFLIKFKEKKSITAASTESMNKSKSCWAQSLGIKIS